MTKLDRIRAHVDFATYLRLRKVRPIASRRPHEFYLAVQRICVALDVTSSDIATAARPRKQAKAGRPRTRPVKPCSKCGHVEP